jgi:hypothetical protein
VSLLASLQVLYANIIYTVPVDWNTITDGIHRLFLGGNYTDPNTGQIHYITGLLGGDPIIVAMIIFLFFIIIIGLFGMTLIIGSVILLPLMFFLFQWIPPLRIIVAIILGIIFGFGLHRIIRR